MSDIEQPKLNIKELATIANIIDVSVQRGAFKANEIKEVGELYEKLVNFISYISRNAEENDKGENQ
jgi:hypothetical protein